MVAVVIAFACVANVPVPVRAERNIGPPEGRTENGATTKSAENGARAKAFPFQYEPNEI